MNRPCIAFKLNYCNGGGNFERVGFCGTCQNNVRWFNFYENKARDLWCRHPNCACRRYYEEDSFPEEFICNECTALRDWKFSVGNDKPQRIRYAKDNHLCLLTTVRPNMPEYDRVVFALFAIRKIFRGDDEHTGCIEADDYWRLEFRPREVHRMKFWDVYENPNAPQKKFWGTGLFRYFDDATAIKFLERAVEVKRGTPEENFAKEFLKHYQINLRERAL